MTYLKRWRHALPILTLVALIILAAGLSQVQFGNGFKIASEAESTSSPNASASLPNAPPGGVDAGKEIVIVLLWGFLVASILSIILWPDNLKETLKRALGATVWLVAIYFVYSQLRRQNGQGRSGPLDGPSDTVNPQDVLPGWNEAQVPFWFTLLILALIVGGIVAILVGFFLFRRFWKAEPEDHLLHEVAEAASRAAHDLRTGTQLRDVVLRCYHEMSLLLSQKKKIALGAAMTAREFEQRLKILGVQNEPVHRLTVLFEKVRYGRAEPSEGEEGEALACLDAIAKTYKPAS
jgi:hypothetical protein